MKNLIYQILKYASKQLLKRYNPTIIGVIGNVGKTSMRANMVSFLSQFSPVGTNIDNYNTPIGITLSLLDEVSPGKNIFSWIRIIMKALSRAWFGYAQFAPIWVLEIGIDTPGDMDEFVENFLEFDVVVFGFIGKNPVHLAQFQNRKELVNEDAKILRGLKSDGVLIIDGDDEVLKSIWRKRENVITFGFGDVDIKASDFKVAIDVVNTKEQWSQYYSSLVPKASFKVEYRGSSIPFQVDYILGKHQVNAVLPSIALGIVDGINLIDISQQIKKVNPVKGRLRCLEGIKDTLLIDDTYNAAPAAVALALDSLDRLKVPGARKVAILGAMRELGPDSQQIHQDIGQLAAKTTDVCIGVGEDSKDILLAFHKHNPKGLYHWFADSEEAALHIVDFITSDDIILVKGSQFSRMERVSAELLSNKRYKTELLTRQSAEWL
jgi:UDP-N-acetylmuramoyl-tripeptide--D-alanyl-D-alanine ligase